MLRGVFERYGPVDDVVTFPGRMYAFVNFKEPADAAKAAEAVQVGRAAASVKVAFVTASPLLPRIPACISAARSVE